MVKRFIWGNQDFPLLQNIILNTEGGKYKRIIGDCEPRKNMEKLQAWTEAALRYFYVRASFTLVPVLIYLYALGSL